MYEKEVKMIEILQVIILACQVGNGFKVIKQVDKYQKKCQKQLIECVEKTKYSMYGVEIGKRWSPDRLSECIKDKE